MSGKIAKHLFSFRNIFGRKLSDPVWPGGAGEAVAAVRADGVIIALSEGARDVFGAPVDALIGRSLYDFAVLENRKPLQGALAAALDKGECVAAEPISLVQADGVDAPAEIAFAPASLDEATVLIRKRAAVAAAPLDGEVLRQQAARAQEEAATRADLMADLGHEMKTPLNAIMGFADAMRAETFGPLGSEKYAEYAKLIHGAGAHLLDLIGSILDFSKIEAGRYALSPICVDAGVLAHECAELVRQMADEAGLDLRVSVNENVGECQLDPRALRQILLNLLTNAVKFTSDGEVALTVSSTDNVVTFVVSDTGVGMSEKELAQLGARFTAAQGDGVRGAKGTGLGLSLSYALADLMGGSLELCSAPGEGVTAEVRLPIGAADRKPTSPLLRSVPAGVEEGDIKSQLDRVAEFRRERTNEASAA